MRPFAFIAALLLGATGTASAQDAAGLAACRDLEDDAERLACYDARAGAAAAPAKPAPAPRPGPSPESLFGLDPAQASEATRQANGVEDLDAITRQVVGTGTNSGGQPTFTLDNGQGWVQIDSRPAVLRPGETVTIRRGVFGSYLLTRDDRRSVRVRRVD